MALDLNAAGAGISIPSMDAPTDKTFAMWINVDTYAGSFNTLIEFGNDSPWFGIRSNGLIDCFNVNPVATDVVTTGAWLHVVYTSDSATDVSQIYFNGIPNGSAGTANTQTGTGMGIGYKASGEVLDIFNDSQNDYADTLYRPSMVLPASVGAAAVGKTIFNLSPTPAANDTWEVAP
jgi:hypothetical protein